ncbi:MAG: molybdate ABC transporter substrate-binding protein [Steroidobacteraceae bacterium]|nr:molybdate ABC transporter substrate-binding protein [Deltaproteobacteria bacterium]
MLCNRIPIFLTIIALLSFTTRVSAAEINLSAAASLKEAVNEISDSFARRHPAVKFLKNYGASGTLAKQIESGAPADIFISANPEWIEYLKNKKQLDAASIRIFTDNSLVFAGDDSKVSSMQDLIKLQRIAIGSPKSVPAGEYAAQAIRKAGLDKLLDKKLVMARDVREGLMYAERGEVDGAFVYLTDALQAKRARILFTVPQELHSRITYPMALTVGGAKNGAAASFYIFLQSAEAREILVKYGFTIK